MHTVVAFAASTSRAVFLTGLMVASSACSATPAPAAADPSGADPAGAAAPADAPPGDSGSTPTAAPGPAGAPAPGSSSGAGGGGQVAAPGSTIAAVDSTEDAHWVQADDYFVLPRAFKQGWLTVHLAKMKEPPKAGGDGEALFFFIHDGRDERSAHYYRTRPAVKADLVLGNTLICFDNNKRDKVYQAPKSKDNARPGGWWIAKITDLSDLGKGYATLSGSYHCAPDALRAIVK